MQKEREESTCHMINPPLSKRGLCRGRHAVSATSSPQKSPLRPCGLTEGEPALLPEIVNLRNLPIGAVLSAALVTTTRASELESVQWQRQRGKQNKIPHEVLIFFSHVRMAL